jgi:hypothetical protein
MANMAKQDLEKREVRVERDKLLATLKANRESHLREYTQARSVYRQRLLQRVQAAFADAAMDLEEKRQALVAKIEGLSEEDIDKQVDTFKVVDSVRIEMRVPRSYVKEYDLAIRMVDWDTRAELELSYAEFCCFVLDQWDWKESFVSVTSMYLG